MVDNIYLVLRISFFLSGKLIFLQCWKKRLNSFDICFGRYIRYDLCSLESIQNKWNLWMSTWLWFISGYELYVMMLYFHMETLYIVCWQMFNTLIFSTLHPIYIFLISCVFLFIIFIQIGPLYSLLILHLIVHSRFHQFPYFKSFVKQW